MRKSICLAIILAVFCMEEVPAQKIAKTKENPAVKAYSDSLSALSVPIPQYASMTFSFPVSPANSTASP